MQPGPVHLLILIIDAGIKHQTPSIKSQIIINKTIFKRLTFGYWNLFDICDLDFVFFYRFHSCATVFILVFRDSGTCGLL